MGLEQKTVSERNKGHLWPLGGNFVDTIAKDQQSGPCHPARTDGGLNADRVYQRETEFARRYSSPNHSDWTKIDGLPSWRHCPMHATNAAFGSVTLTS